ncbi:hypothetical protein EDC01DRAFT_708224 [Geopyxis carbonaria]|nr:hypothetical protein EDC01DRAFT_708224 [Geopyxis carbonaria]
MAIRAGYLPSTQQLTAWGNRLLRTNPLLDSRQRGLSTESRAFVRDLRAWVEALIDLGVQKNGQDLVQEFIWHTQHANVDVDGSGSVGNRSEVREDSGEAVKKLRTLGSLLWSNSEFRDMLGEAIAVAREMFADAASNVASNANAAADSARSDNDFELPSTSDVKNKVHESLFSSKEELESYLREKFPQQRRDSAVERLKKIVKEVQSKPEFQGTMEFLIELGKKYINRLKDQAEGVHVDGDDNFEKACNDAHAILESFTGKKPLDDLNSAFRKLIQEIQNDDELTSFYSDASHTLHLFLTDPSHVDSNAAHDLYARSKSLLDEKKDTYAPAASYLSTATQSVVHALKTDKPSSRLLAASRTLAASSMSLSMLADLAPRALTSLHYLPLPPITYHSSDYKLHLSELLLESTAPSGFLPKHTLIDALQHLDITTAPIPASSLSTSSHIKLSNLSLRLTDAAFSLQKKSGFLRFRDTGTISIQIAGASAEIHLTTNTNTSANTHAHAAWDVADVAVDIHDFSYNYRGDRHAWAATLLGPFLRPAVRKLLEKVLEARIHEALETAGREVLMLREDVAAAAGKNKDKGWMQWGQAVWSKIRGVGGGGGGGRDAGEGWLAMLEGVRGGDGWGLDSGVEERAPEGEGGWRSNVFEIGSTS